jgi:hypothetical protein
MLQRVMNDIYSYSSYTLKRCLQIDAINVCKLDLHITLIIILLQKMLVKMNTVY